MKELEKLIKIKSYGWVNILVNLVSQYTSSDKYGVTKFPLVGITLSDFSIAGDISNITTDMA